MALRPSGRTPLETATSKVRAAEFFQAREALVAFLRRKWARELDDRLIEEL